MGHLEELNEHIEALRGYLNDLIEKNEDGDELLLVSQQLDKLLVEYYSIMNESSY